MKLCILIATWKRPEITELCYKNLSARIAEQRGKLDIMVMVIASEQTHVKLAKKYKFEVCEHPNLPLGTKLNYGLAQCLKYDWDYFTQIGSDDVLHPDLFNAYMPYFTDNIPVFGLNSSVWLDIKNKKAIHYINDIPTWAHGGARCLIREAIERSSIKQKVILNRQLAGPMGLQYRGEITKLPLHIARSYVNNNIAKYAETDDNIIEFWPPQANRALDSGSERTFLAMGYIAQVVNVPHPMVYDLKSDENIWTFDTIEGKGIEVDFNEASKFIILK